MDLFAGCNWLGITDKMRIDSFKRLKMANGFIKLDIIGMELQMK